MSTIIKGLHHITAIASDAKRNYLFYTYFLGLRMVKKTVNFDDPHTYHLYFGNYQGEPGTLITFFPWGSAMSAGRRGTKQATSFSFSIPQGAIDFWLERAKAHNVVYNNPAERFGQTYLTILDPDGLKIELVASPDLDNRPPVKNAAIPEAYGIRGFYTVSLTLTDYEKTAELLVDQMDYSLTHQQVNHYRFTSKADVNARYVDLIHTPEQRIGHIAAGSIHHVAFLVDNDKDELIIHDKFSTLGYNITSQIDRDYFKSLYFREPGGVLFEIATLPPGFTIDEPLESLGTSLKLPNQHENLRIELERSLPKL